MLIYWFLLVLPTYFLLFKNNNGNKTPQVIWVSFGLFLTIIIGLRNEIGCDWTVYLAGLQTSKEITWDQIIETRLEIGYTIISWLSIALGADIYGINFFCAAVFTFGLISLSKSQPYPWISILVSIPYLVIVVAMGYTRQAAALGFLMIGIGYLIRKKVLIYLLFVLLAALFHRTAFIFLSFVFFLPGGGKLKRIFAICTMVIFLGGAYLLEQVDIFIVNYVQNTMESEGGQVRILMNMIASFILLLFWNKWNRNFTDRWLWGLFAFISSACLPLVFFASTAVDRMALYLIPIQLVVWARLPLFTEGKMERKSLLFIIIIYANTTLFIWINFANHSSCWLPYNNLLFNFFQYN